MATLRIERGPGAGECIDLEVGFTLEVGRNPGEADSASRTRVLIVDDRRASRRHCRIRHSEGRWVIEDSGSGNGTFVNGKRITERVLRPGDRVQVGGAVLAWSEGPEGAFQRPAEMPEPAETAGGRSVAEGGEEPEHGARRLGDGECATREGGEAEDVRAGGTATRRAPLLSIAAVCVVGIAAAVYFLGLLSGRPGGPGGGGAPGAVGSPRDSGGPEATVAPGRGAAVEKLPASPSSGPDTRGATALVQTKNSKAPARAASPELNPISAGPASRSDLLGELTVFLEDRDFEGALGFLDDFQREHPGVDVESLRAKALDDARAEVSRVRAEAERLSGEGDVEGARAIAFELAMEIPDVLAEEATAVLEIVRVGDAARLEDELAKQAAGPGGLDEEIQQVARRCAELRADPPAELRPWKELLAAVESLVEKYCRGASYAQRRREVKPVYLEAWVRVSAEEKGLSAFHATRVEREGDRVVIGYAFESDAELLDFDLRAGGGAEGDSEIRREGNTLILRGECRLLRGEPFERSLVVRGRVPAGGYEPQAPNLMVALFTSEADHLTPKRPRSLLTPAIPYPGEPADDFVAFALGYRTVVAEYGGTVIEEVPIAGEAETLKLPAHVVMAGRRGTTLHSDPREGVWGVRVSAAMRGDIEFEVRLEDGRASWRVGGISILGGESARLSRLERRPDRMGSVTLCTQGATVRLRSLEIEAVVRQGWLIPEGRREALRALRSLEAAARKGPRFSGGSVLPGGKDALK